MNYSLVFSKDSIYAECLNLLIGFFLFKQKLINLYADLKMHTYEKLLWYIIAICWILLLVGVFFNYSELFTETPVFQINSSNWKLWCTLFCLLLCTLLGEGKGNSYSNTELKLVLEKGQRVVYINFKITCDMLSYFKVTELNPVLNNSVVILERLK